MLVGPLLAAIVGYVAAAAAAPLPVARLNDGTSFPLVSLGTAGYNDSETTAAMLAAAGVGLLAFDTAFNYDNQVGVGKGVRAILEDYPSLTRADIYVITKVSPCIHPSRPSYNITDPAACYNQTMHDLQSDLQQTGLAHVDMLLLHGPSHQGDGACGDLANRLNRAQFDALTDFRKQQKTTSVGVSNYCISCLEGLLVDARKVVPAINQIALHVGMGSDPDGIASYSSKHGILVQAYSPLASGALIADPLLQAVAQAYPSYSAAQVALRWLVQHDWAVACKASEPAYIAQDISVFAAPLSAADMARLDAATSPAQPASWGCSQ